MKDSMRFVAGTAISISLLFCGPGSAAFAADPPVKTVAQVFAESEGLNGKQITVRGKVVKFNSGILGRNFVHIQDGTGKEGTSDLTVTTLQQVKVGDKVSAMGTVVTDKNFGSGYSYKVLVEDAQLKIE